MSPDSPNLDPRVYFAAERTLLAWIRTGLAMMGFGFVVARFGLLLSELANAGEAPQQSQSGPSLWFGTTLIIAGVIVQAASLLQYMFDISRLRRGEIFMPRHSVIAIALGAFLMFLGIGMAGYLLFLVRA